MTNVCGACSFGGSRSTSKVAAFHFAYFPYFGENNWLLNRKATKVCLHCIIFTVMLYLVPYYL